MPPTPVSTGTATGSSIGAVFGGGGSLSGSSASACASTMNGLQNAMMGSGTKIPLLAAYDFVHGASAVPGATMLPHNLALGAIQDTLLIQKAWRVAALEVRGSGCNWGFGPCIAVIRDDRWGRAYEGFTEDPTRCALMARHAVLGCQTTDLSLPTAYAACVKHFAGDGNTVNGVNQGTTVGPDATARAINLPGYASAVAVGVASVMPSFSNWCDGTAMSFNSTLMTGWLKSTASGNPGFMGFIVSDWEAGSSNWGSSINAGVDVPMAPGEGTGIIGTINGIYGARVQDACKRVLRIKCQMNLFSPSQYLSNPQLTAVVGSAPHRAIARQCVRESMVLLKTGNAALPIPKTASVAVWGQGADDIGIQCGGWTVSWQGQTGSIPGGGGTSIRTGIASTCTGTVTYSNNGSNSGNATYIIAVLSENPYAETSFGDISLTNDITGSSVGAGPANTQMATSTNSAVISAIATAHAAGKKVIGILVAGRPLDISGVLPNCDAFIWAGLPGSEGNGVADCLFGDYNFKGKLPVTWPKASGQLQTDNGTTRSNGLFAFGFGLSY
jgi:beta-glucosidase